MTGEKVWIFWILSLVVSCYARYTEIPQIPQSRSTVMLHDICAQSPYGTKRFFLDEGQNGTLIAKNLNNEDTPGISNQRSYYSYYYPNPYLYYQQAVSVPGKSQQPQRVCSVELTSCPSCSIRLEFKILNLPTCDNNTTQCSGCDHLAIKENYYASPSVICGSGSSSNKKQRNPADDPHVYHSIGRSLTFSFVFSQAYEYAFLLEFASVANTRLILGRNGDQGVISSPHFPNVYPQDYSSEVKLRNKEDSINQSGFIRLIFDDFALGTPSYIDISDANGTKHYWLGGILFRPPAILIRSNEISIRFFANGGRASGYRATYKFISSFSPEANEIPATDCGGVVDTYGGSITMSNMTTFETGNPMLYDCVWLIKPLLHESAIRTHLQLLFEQFSSLERGTSIEIRQGMTSLSPLVETLSSEIQSGSNPLMMGSTTNEYLVPADIGFYVRLRGRLGNNFKLAVAFSAFSYTECYTMKEFVCLNHRCISSNLRCDGFNHCGDNSDEQTACPNQNLSLQDPSWWLTHTPNYYFPKRDQFGDLGATSLVLFISAVGVLIFIASIMALLYRMSSHSQLMNERQARLDFIRAQLANASEETPELEEPPCYEAPPDYDEISKLAELAKENSVNYDQTGGLRVLLPPPSSGTLPPNPTPIRRRHRDMMRQGRAHNLLEAGGADDNGSIMSSPSPSTRSTSTARSRNATPHQRRARRTPASLLAPVHLPIDSPTDPHHFFPISPPPPYEINPDSPYHIFHQVAGPSDLSGAIQEDEPVEVIRAVVDCGCAGACSCVNSSPFLLQLSYQEPTGGFSTTLENPTPSPIPRPDSAAPLFLDPKGEPPTAITLSDQQRAMSRFYLSVDNMLPALSILRKIGWYKSV